MAVKGKIDEFIDFAALEKELNRFTKTVEKTIDDVAKSSVSLFSAGNAVKGSTGIQQQAAAQKKLNDETAKAAKVVKELTIEEAKQKELQRQRAALLKEEINLDANLVGAYKAKSTELQKMIREYKNLAIAQGVNSKEAKAQLAAVQSLDRNIKALDKSVGQHQRNVGNYSSALDNLKGKWLALTGGFAAATAALGGTVALLKSAIQGAMEDERAMKRLSFSMDGNSAAMKRMLAFKERMMKGTLFSEEEIMGAISMGSEMGRTEAQTRKLVETAMGLARLTGTDLNTKMLALSGTYEGQTGRLGKLSGELKGLTETQLRNGEAVDILNKKYGKLASEGLTSVEGEVVQMRKWWGEAMDDMGLKFITLFRNVTTAMKVIGKVIGGGVSTREAAAGKASATRSRQLAEHEEKMDQLRLEIDRNKELLKVNLAAEESSSAAVKDIKTEYEKLIEVHGEYIAQMIQAEKVRAGMVGQPTATMGQLTGNAAIQRAPSIGPTGRATTPTMTPVANPAPEAGASEKYTMSDLALDAANWNSKIQIAADATAKIDAIVSASFANRIAMIDQEAAKDAEAKDKELAAAGNNKRKKDEIEKRYAAREKEREKERRRLEVEQAKYKKTSGIISGIINTAVAVTGMLANPGGVLGIVLAALAAAAGAAEVAVIASQPIPQYAKGRKGGRGEFAIVGEAGREMIETKGGQRVITPDAPTLTYLPEGSSVIPHGDLVNHTAMASMFSAPSTTAQIMEENEIIRAGFMMLRKTIEDKKEVHLGIDEHGFTKFVRSGAVWEEYLNRRVRL